MSPRWRQRFDPNQLSLEGIEAPAPPKGIQHPRFSGPSAGQRTSLLTPGQIEEENLQFVPITSSRVAAAAYNADSDRLYLVWVKPGRPYVYEGVTSEEWRQFQRSRSKGKFVNRRLNGKTYYAVDL